MWLAGRHFTIMYMSMHVQYNGQMFHIKIKINNNETWSCYLREIKRERETTRSNDGVSGRASTVNKVTVSFLSLSF